MSGFFGASEVDLHAIVDSLIISQMTCIELIEAKVLSVPDIIGGILQIGGSLFHRMLVEAIETRLIDQIKDGLFRMSDG